MMSLIETNPNEPSIDNALKYLSVKHFNHRVYVMHRYRVDLSLKSSIIHRSDESRSCRLRVCIEMVEISHETTTDDNTSNQRIEVSRYITFNNLGDQICVKSFDLQEWYGRANAEIVSSRSHGGISDRNYLDANKQHDIDQWWPFDQLITRISNQSTFGRIMLSWVCWIGQNASISLKWWHFDKRKVCDALNHVLGLSLMVCLMVMLSFDKLFIMTMIYRMNNEHDIDWFLLSKMIGELIEAKI